LSTLTTLVAIVTAFGFGGAANAGDKIRISQEVSAGTGVTPTHS